MLSTTSVLRVNKNLTNTLIINGITNYQRRNVNVFAEFGNSLKRQSKENKEFRESVDYFSKKADVISKTAPVRIVKSATNKTKVKIQNTKKNVVSYIESDSVQQKCKKMQRNCEHFGNTILKISHPFVHNPITRTVHNISNIITSTSTTARYNEFLTKDEREILFKKKLATQKFSKVKYMESNENAGSSLVLYKMPFFKRLSYNFKNNSTFAQKYNNFKNYLDDQDGPLMDSFRNIASKLQGMFEESEMSKTVKRFSSVHPGFSIEKFIKDCQMLYLPEVLEAYLKGDSETLKKWCGEVTYNVLNAGLEAQKAQGLSTRCELIELRNLELNSAKFLENDTPVLVLSFNTQEILAFSDKDGKVVVGKEDNIQHCIYAVVFSKSQFVDPKRKIDPRTEGWIIIDLAKQDRKSVV